MKRRRATAADVARAAAVSPATVSLVVNGKDAKRVNAETRLRVLKEAAHLGYTVDRRARGLATGRTGLIGFLVPGMRNPFFAAVYTALLREFGSDYQLLTVTTDMGEETRRSLRQLMALGVDAVVAVSVDSAFVRPLKPTMPMVLVDTDRPGRGVTAVNLTDAEAARALALHLVGLGHRKVVYVDAARARSRSFAARRRAFVGALAESAAPAPLEAATEVDIEATRAAVEAEIGGWVAAGATALVCATDLQAYGALVALRNCGIAVPADVSVAAFDDLTLSRVVTPTLTSVHVPADAIARVAAQEIRGMFAGDAPARRSIVLPLELRCRESTGPARRAR